MVARSNTLFLIAISCSAILGSSVVRAQNDTPRSPGDSIARWFSEKIRGFDSELQDIEKQLAELPLSGRTRVTNRLGYHSAVMKRGNQPAWVQVDLKQRQKIDAIALVPLKTESPLYPEGYGFPLRFKVEIADNEDFSDARLIFGHTATDFANPGSYPVLLPVDADKARFVRVTSTRHYKTEEDFAWGLSELIVLSGNYNVAAGKPVRAMNSMHIPNTWAEANLTDSHSTIGMPVTTERSATSGWMSQWVKKQNESKWIEIDLGESVRVDEIRIVPAQPSDMGDTPGIGFPINFVITGGANSGEDAMIFDYETRYYVNPQGNAMVFDGLETPMRYFQIKATKIQRQGAFASFALSEVQIYADGKNIALGKKVEVTDSYNDKKTTRWGPEFLVDGYTSQYRLTELPDYLNQLEERRQTLVRKQEIRRERKEKTEQVLTALAVIATSIFLGLFGFMAAALFRQRRVRLAEANRLRTQIARDLHDDIGSNLGSIALTSQIASAVPGLTEEAREDFEEIHKTAENTAESMRDIVWLIETGNTSFEDLFTKMRDVANHILSEVEHTFTADPGTFAEQTVSLRFRRHVFFAFKETLNNIRKHAGATEVDLKIEIDHRHLMFRIEDNGKGFDMDARRPGGRGVSNVIDRAARIGGSCDFTTKPDCGTVVIFQVPLK